MRSPIISMRLQAFRQRKTAWIALLVLGFLFALSLGAELLANSRPLILHYKGSYYFPVFKHYTPPTFDQKSPFLVNYRKVTLQHEDWVLWPMVRWDPYDSDLSLLHYPAPPSKAHWLGTDDKGRDLLSRLLYGFRISMLFSFAVWIGSYALGMTIGAIQGYFGGRIDFYGQRFSEIWSAVPVFFLILTLIAVLAPSVWLLIGLFVLFGWSSIAQYQRAEFLSLRKRDFVESARAIGLSSWGIMFKHILPNALTPLVTFTPFTIAGAITGIAALDYLGFGLPPPTPSWGELLKQALQHFSTAWWIATFTVGSMFLVLMLLVLINEGIRSAFDPHQN